ncbi:MAG: hypothetical protein EBR34_01935 [Sphingomonadaceae bacterium]|nr:hypothetical protein [Sphingomonadaceae bacterium]
MSTSTQFYLDQADQCGRNAQSAALQNQRDVQLKAQAAWQAMADRAIRTATERDRRDAERRDADTRLALVTEGSPECPKT